jgi:hypothetical protein
MGENRDFGVDAWPVGWRGVRAQSRGIRPWVIDRENGRENWGRGTQFGKRMVPFADRSGMVIRRVSDPPDPRQYNPIERWGSSREKKGNGVW